MPINKGRLYYYELICDKCNINKFVPESDTAYNAAQAARSVGWSYGRNGTVFCDKCRKPYSKK